MTNKLAIGIAVTAALTSVTVGGIVLAVVGGNRQENKTATPDEAVTQVATETASVKPAVLSTVTSEDLSAIAQTDEDIPASGNADEETRAGEPAPTDTATVKEAHISAPRELTDLLAKVEESPQSLYDKGCRQLVTVQSSGSSANICLFQAADDRWTVNDALTCGGYVGSNGVTTDMHEGGYASPFGLFSVGEAFYINSAPETGLLTFQITEDTYWVDDPDSHFYNQRVEGTDEQDWSSAEHMIDFTDSYEYGFVINYNPAAEYNKGSAIFFHVSSGPTAGCIGTSRDMVLSYLKAMDASQNPFILIV